MRERAAERKTCVYLCNSKEGGLKSVPGPEGRLLDNRLAVFGGSW